MRRSKGALARAAKQAAFDGYHFLNTERQANILRRTLVDEVLDAAIRSIEKGKDVDIVDVEKKAEKSYQVALRMMMNRLTKAVAWNKYAPCGTQYYKIEEK